jgi:hypothetical protein
MTSVAERAPQPDAIAAAKTPWRAVHYLAIVGACLLAVQAYVWVSWLADGVHQKTRFRDTGSLAFVAACAFEVAGLALLLGVGTWMVKQCRARGWLSFDAKFCLAALLSMWLDPVANFAQPSWFYSENWLNTNDWVPNIPLHQRTVPMIETPLMNICTYSAGFLLIVIAINTVMRAAHNRWPALSPARLCGVAAIAEIGIFTMFLTPGYILHLWAYPGQPDALAIGAGALRNPVTEYALVPLVMFVPLAAWRYFHNDQGEHWLERDLDRHARFRRPWISLLAMIGLFNLILLSTELLHTATATYSARFPTLPNAIIAGVCTVPGGHAHTAYGPCPGSPGYRLRLASSATAAAGSGGSR